MGTLYNQLPREDHLNEERLKSLGTTIQFLAQDLKISYLDAISLYLAAAKIDDYNAKDEQLAGFGEILVDMKDSLNYIGEMITRLETIQVTMFEGGEV